MAGVCAVISYDGEPPAKELSTILSFMGLRGGDGYGISNGIENLYLKDPPEPEDIPFRESSLIGYTYKREILQDFRQPIEGENFTIAGDGEVYLGDEIQGVSRTLVCLRKPIPSSLVTLLKDLDGIYAAILNSKEKGIYALRDPLGIKPLYYGRGRNFIALASERKALWAVGVKHPVSFPPGSIGRFSKHIDIRRLPFLLDGKPTSGAINRSIDTVILMLRESVKKRTKDARRVAMAFSGGLDSSLIAFLTRELGLKVELYAALIEDAPEIEGVSEAARLLDLPLNLEVREMDSILGELDEILWFIEEPDRMKLEVAMPLYMAAMKAYRDGHRMIFSGQGSDELFGGYRKFLSILGEKGWNGLDNAIKEAVKNSYRINFERDEPVITGVGLTGRFPYTDRNLTCFGLKLSPKLKIYGEGDNLRKRILREAALKLGLPKPLALKQKRSAQYGSGVHYAITKIAKKMSLAPSELLEQSYKRVLGKLKEKKMINS